MTAVLYALIVISTSMSAVNVTPLIIGKKNCDALGTATVQEITTKLKTKAWYRCVEMEKG